MSIDLDGIDVSNIYAQSGRKFSYQDLPEKYDVYFYNGKYIVDEDNLRDVGKTTIYRRTIGYHTKDGNWEKILYLQYLIIDEKIRDRYQFYADDSAANVYITSPRENILWCMTPEFNYDAGTVTLKKKRIVLSETWYQCGLGAGHETHISKFKGAKLL